LDGLLWKPAEFIGRLLPAETFVLPATRHTLLCPVSAPALHPDFDAILAGLLRADTHALILVCGHRFQSLNQRLYQRWRQHFPQEVDRIQFLPPLSPFQLLSLAAAVDIVLDPLYCGLQALVLSILATGTPVISWPGAFQRSRMTRAAYQLMNLDVGVVDSAEAYIATALHWAEDTQARQELRETLRTRSFLLDSTADYQRGLHAFIDTHLQRSF
jgi:predicted O-linked N-acetylglucosamine transferase (SPINDLY family)